MSNYCQLTIKWQYFDDILMIFWHRHLRSLSSFTLPIVIYTESFQMLLWPIFAAKITQTYLNVRQKPLWVTRSPKRSQAIILGGRVGCVNWVPPCWCDIFGIKEIFCIACPKWTVSCVSMSKKLKSPFFKHVSISPHDSWLTAGLHVESMDSNVTKSLSFMDYMDQ